MRKGFTMIELLIVMAVIGILIGITLPRFRGMQEEGNIAKAKGELRTLQVGVESFYMHNNNAYPAKLADLIKAAPNILGPVLPVDPFNSSTNYGYAMSPDKNYYVIWSVGALKDGSVTISNTGSVTEKNGASCIYITNVNSKDTQP